jgi:hypothetical protein
MSYMELTGPALAAVPTPEPVGRDMGPYPRLHGSAMRKCVCEVRGPHHGAEMLAHEVGVLAHGLADGAEDDALRAQHASFNLYAQDTPIPLQ